ncbi:MAG: hypothetical protein JWM32_1028 [Verrucomicrobia bacterium]|nr:hypothetical protein [Verrucomicrobiota bacterium]
MKTTPRFLLAALILAGLQFGLCSCVTDGYVSTGVYYGPHYNDPWFNDGPWLNGHRGYGEGRGGFHGPYIHPPRGHFRGRR